MDAFRWDDESRKCVESLVGEMNPRLPMLHMEPKKNFTPDSKEYVSPLYRTAARAGTLSTTGKFISPWCKHIFIDFNQQFPPKQRSFNKFRSHSEFTK